MELEIYDDSVLLKSNGRLVYVHHVHEKVTDVSITVGNVGLFANISKIIDKREGNNG